MKTTIKNQNILVSGASIAGPALAYWLKKYGFNVAVIEKAPVLRGGGYRIDVRGVAVEVAERMGIMYTIREKRTRLEGSSIVNSKGKHLLNVDDPNLFGMRQANDAEIMRGDLANILYDFTKNDTEYIFNDSITGIMQSDEDVKVTFRNRPPGTFDLVVGADGLRSNVRNLAFGDDPAFVSDLGFYVSIFTIPNYFDLDRGELSYPMAGKIINVSSAHNYGDVKALFMFASASINYNYKDMKQQKGILTDHFADAGWETAKILEAMEDADDFYFDSMSQVHMNSLSKGRVVLLGDAGYCPSPASGQGTSLALVGAYILAGELAEASGDYQVAFSNYQREMRDFIKINQELGVSVVKEMIPKSKKQVWFQTTMLRLLLHLPWKDKILNSMMAKIQRSVTDAANGITLKDYNAYVVESN